MRLKAPEPFVPWDPGFEPDDCLHGVGLGLSGAGAVLLPREVGQVYVGETFRSYISVHNQSAAPVRRVFVRAELRTQQQVTVVLDTSSELRAVFPPRTNQDYIVQHPLTEAGAHTLVCTVYYIDDFGQEERNLSKGFNFRVSQPLSVKAVKIYTVKDHVFVVLELQNLMTTPLFLDSVVLEPTEAYVLTDHSPLAEDPAVAVPMAVEEVRRFLFELVPTGPTGKSNTLGKVDIYWKASLGGAGHLQTTPLKQNRAGDRQDVELLVDSVPHIVRLEVPFEVGLAVHNHTDQDLPIALQLHPDRMHPLCLTGPTLLPLGVCPARGAHRFPLTLFAVHTGIHSLNGLEVRDTRTDRAFPFNSLCILFVDH